MPITANTARVCFLARQGTKTPTGPSLCNLIPGACEMSQLVKVLAAKLVDLSSIPRAYVVESEN